MSSQYSQFLSSIKERIRKSQYEALKAVNKELIMLYWDIGHIIVERQKKHAWGKAVVENLARDLQAEFTGVAGFSSSNLWRMKLFYEEYANSTKLAPMVREISWSHNVCIMEKCKFVLDDSEVIVSNIKKPVVSAGEETLYKRIRDLIYTARQHVARGVDLVQVHTNFEIGWYIVEHEQGGEKRAIYGDELLAVLADRLSKEFGKGFSRTNIAYMRSFFLAYQDRRKKVQTVSGKLPKPVGLTTDTPFQIIQTLSGLSTPRFSLSWSHYVFLLGIKNSDERSFYEIEAISQGWTLSELKRQCDSSLYERLALSRDKDGIRQLSRNGQVINKPKDIIYTL